MFPKLKATAAWTSLPLQWLTDKKSHGLMSTMAGIVDLGHHEEAMLIHTGHEEMVMCSGHLLG